MPGYYDGWESETFSCSKCNWKGSGAECKQGEMFNELFELDCPRCGRKITVIIYPTIEESHANRDKVSEADKQLIEAREQFIKKAATQLLETPDELPDIEGENLVFVWDFVRDDFKTVIRYGNKVIWREPAFYEGYPRFGEVALILKEKYGARFIDLAPTERSLDPLYGDYLSSIKIIECVRDWIGLGEWQDIPTKKGWYGRTDWDWIKVVVEKPAVEKIEFLKSRSAQQLSKLPRLYTTEQLPDIHSDEEMIFVWDKQEAAPVPQIVIRYGRLIVWQEFSYYGCYNRFEPIALLLQQKYGKKVKDLIPTRRSEIELYGEQKNAESIVSEPRGNLWMGRYAAGNEKDTQQAGKGSSADLNSKNTKPVEAVPPSNNSEASEKPKPKYEICVDDNFHYMDESERYTKGKYETCEEAVRVCRKMVDDFLTANYKPGMTADELYKSYDFFGDDPFIVSDDRDCRFSAWEYARKRCDEICG